MLPEFAPLRFLLAGVIVAKGRQGHVVDGLQERLDALPDSYDALAAFSRGLTALPLRPDWRWREPDSLADIHAACPRWPSSAAAPQDAAGRAAEGFLASACGCILGKPLEVDPTSMELEQAAKASGTPFPFTGYITDAYLAALGRRHHSWVETERSRIRYAAQDDDLNYSLMGLLVLERHGGGFTQQQLLQLWHLNLPAGHTFGSERLVYACALLDSFRPWSKDAKPHVPDIASFSGQWNPREEGCGAAIRADAYGFACPGDPGRAADLAWRDATLTHRRTGVYATMCIAAWIAAAFVERDWRRLAEAGLAVVPAGSRLYEHLAWAVGEVAASADWREANARIHARLGEYRHCLVHQEMASMVNTLRFSATPAEAIALQVAQGMDTDSFGCSMGSISGVRFGPGSLDRAWLAPFADRVRHGLTDLGEDRLSALAERFGALHRRLADGVSAASQGQRDAATGL